MFEKKYELSDLAKKRIEKNANKVAYIMLAVVTLLACLYFRKPIVAYVKNEWLVWTGLPKHFSVIITICFDCFKGLCVIAVLAILFFTISAIASIVMSESYEYGNVAIALVVIFSNIIGGIFIAVCTIGFLYLMYRLCVAFFRWFICTSVFAGIVSILKWIGGIILFLVVIVFMANTNVRWSDDGIYYHEDNLLLSVIFMIIVAVVIIKCCG